MDEHTLTERLRRMGRAPLAPEVRDDHLHRMAAVDTRPRREKRFGRVAVAAAAIVGFMAGSTGLAIAGALPDPAQGVAHDVLSVVQVEVPKTNRGQCISGKMKAFEGQPDTADTAEAKKAAKAQCGVPGPPAERGNGNGAPGERGRSFDKHAGDDCKGRPPWAGTGKPDPDVKADFEAKRVACPADQAEVEPEG